MMRRRVSIAVGLTVFLTLAGTSAGSAYWSDRVQASVSVTAGSIDVHQSGFESLGVVYSSPSETAAASITLKNTGSLAADYRMTLSGSSTTTLVGEIQVRVWERTGSGCTTMPAQAKRATWATVPAQKGQLGGGATIVYCVRTMPAAGATNTIGTVKVSLLVASSLADGKWASTFSPDSVSQEARDWTAPSRPGAPTASGTTSSATTLTWAASTDNSGSVLYDLYLVDSAGAAERVLEGVISPLEVKGLKPQTTFTYLVKARDSAGNTSEASEPVSVTTGKKNDCGDEREKMTSDDKRCPRDMNSTTRPSAGPGSADDESDATNPTPSPSPSPSSTPIPAEETS